MRHKAICILIITCLTLLTSISNTYAETLGITPKLEFNKTEYSQGEMVKMSLKLTGVKSGDKTNSVTFEVEYDKDAFELSKGDPQKDINDGYIKFTTKSDSLKEGTKRIKLMYVDPSADIDLKNGDTVFSVDFRVKDTSPEGDKIFRLKAVDMFDSSFKVYSIGEYTKTVKVLPAKPKKKFKDTNGHWSEKYVDIMVSRNITLGLDENNFGTEGGVTRAQFAAFLSRALNLEQIEYQGNFKDVKSSDWYADVVATASKAGIIKGASDGSFLPTGLISREEMAVMIMRAYEYATHKKVVDEAKNYKPKFNDIDSINGWAQDSVKAANALGMINGMTETTFVPAEKATRAQAAKMIVKFLEVSGLI